MTVGDHADLDDAWRLIACQLDLLLEARGEAQEAWNRAWSTPREAWNRAWSTPWEAWNRARKPGIKPGKPGIEPGKPPEVPLLPLLRKGAILPLSSLLPLLRVIGPWTTLLCTTRALYTAWSTLPSVHPPTHGPVSVSVPGTTVLPPGPLRDLVFLMG